MPVKNPKPEKPSPSSSKPPPRPGGKAKREADYAQYELPESIEDRSGDVAAGGGAALMVPVEGSMGRHPAMGGPGAGMAHGWDERAQMNMLNHMMAMQNNMNVMAMNLMAQQRAFGNSGSANDGDGTSSGQGNPASPFPGQAGGNAAFANPQVSGVPQQFMGMSGTMPPFNGQQMAMNPSGVQGLLAQIDSESLQAALLARAILENRRQDASRAGPGQAQPSDAQNDQAASGQDNAVDGEPGKDQKKLAPDGQSQYPNQPRILSEKDS